MRVAPRLLAIDLLRFVCAAAVMAHHYVGGWSLRSDMAVRPGRWAACGWIGVELFFVLSGYAITLSAAESGAGAFLRRRVLRLLPGAWIAATFTAIVLLATGRAPATEVMVRWCGSIVFWPLAPQIDPAYWTLGLETVFYLLVAARLGLARPGAPQSLEPVAAGLAAASLAYWLAQGAWGWAANPPFMLSLTLIPHGAFFATGIVLAGAADRGWTARRVAVLAIAGVAAGHEIVAHARLMNAAIALDAGPWAALALYAGGVAVVAGAPRWQSTLARRRSVAPILLLGAVSYPLYLIHQTAGSALILTATASGVPATAASMLVAALMLALAVAVARYGEPGLRAWLASRLDAVTGLHALRPDNRRIASPPAG